MIVPCGLDSYHRAGVRGLAGLDSPPEDKVSHISVYLGLQEMWEARRGVH